MCRDMQLGSPCDVLAAWDLRENTDSRGALLFRRFWERAASASPSPWAHPFDANDPVNTPNTLDTSNPQVRAALNGAISDLNGAGIPLDGPLGQFQFITKNGTRIPIHGGPGTDGQFNAINVKWADGKGYGEPEHGSSYVQVVTWGKSRCPNARTILTYSESVNPNSPFYGDQTRLYSQKKWVRDRFCRQDVLRGTQSTTRVRTGHRTRVRRASSG
jgi:acyl-homoserine-lactone acylase